jgi:hypothetical protein
MKLRSIVGSTLFCTLMTAMANATTYTIPGAVCARNPIIVTLLAAVNAALAASGITLSC